MILLENVTFRYPNAEAPSICDLDLRIDRGESVCIMGGNGSGKSTLAALIAGLLVPQKGQVTVEETKETDLRVGLLFQNPDNQFIAVVVEKEVAFGLENLGIPPKEIGCKISDILKSFSISHLRNNLTAELSGGEKQRVALASIMALNPQILILDEPDSYLDQTGKKALELELSRLRQQSPDMTEIRITQYPQVAKNYKRLIVLADGEIASDDCPQKIFAKQEFCERHGLVLSPDKESDLSGSGSMLLNRDIQGTDIRRIKLQDISFGYPGRGLLFENLDLELKSGEILCIVGSSGSGKTSLGHLICGLQKQTDGSVNYYDPGDQEISKAALVGRITGVFQFPERQFFLPTCIEELHFGPNNLDSELSDERINELFEMVALDRDQISDRDPVTLSVGEKRRLAIATVLAMSPNFIIFDEPTCGLDQAGVGMFIQTARQLKQNGVGLIIISHDGDLVSRLADRVLIMSNDEKPKTADPEQLFEDHEMAALLSPPGISTGKMS